MLVFSFTLIPTHFIFHRSFVNLTSPTSSSSSHLSPFDDPESFYSPPPTSPTSVPTPPYSDCARLLRRTARSNLVNAYRRHVVPELTSRLPKEGGFSVWILHSMRRRTWERMEDLIEEGARIQQEHQQVLELRQHDEQEEQQQFQYQERAKSPIPVDIFGMEEAGFSTTAMNIPLSFSDEAGSTENENESANVSRISSEEVEGDLETITDGSSIHTPSSTSHIGTGFMGGDSSTSPTTIQPPPLLLKSSPLNSQLPLPSHFLIEYNQLSCLHQRLHSLILFADSQIRIAEEDKQNRDEILLVRARRRAWLNGELTRGIGGATTGASNGMGQMQWGFAAPFKSSPLARYSWSASAKLDEASNASVNYTSVYPQYEEDEDEYDEFHGPPVARNTLDYAHGRQSRRSRYSNGGGRLCGKLLPVAEECECEIPILDDVNPNDGFVHDSYHHRDTCLHLHQEDEDVDSTGDIFSLEGPRETDFELGFGLHDSTSFIAEDAEELLGDDNRRPSSEQVGDEEEEEEYDQRERCGETSRIAFEMERPKIILRVRDGLGGMDDDSISMTMSVGTSNSTSTSSTRSGGGLLSWGCWGVGKNSGNGNSDSGEGAIRGNRSWKNGLGIGIALGSRGRSLNKTCQNRELEKVEEEEEELLSGRRRPRISTSSSASTASSSSTKSQQRHLREPAQVEAEPGLHQDQDKDHSLSTPLLCQPVSFSVHTVPAQAAISVLPRPATPTGSPPTTVAISLPNDDDDTPTTPKDTAENPKDTARTLSVSANGTKTPTAPLSFTTKKLCVGSPAPNVYADLDVSVVHVVEDEKSLNHRSFDGASQSINRTETQAQGGAGRTPGLRPRRHKREYRYQYPYQQQHYQHVSSYGNEDECDEFELSGYGQFSGGSTSTTTTGGGDSTHLLYPKHHHHHQHQQRHNSMIHARLHLDELLLEEGCHDSVDQEEFTLAMDLPLSRTGGRASNSRNLKAMKKMQFLQLYQNRDSVASQQQSQQQQPSRLQVYEQQQQQQQVESSSPPSSSQATTGSVV